MSARTDRVLRLAALVGAALQIEDVQNGWPALATLHSEGSPIPIALFVGSVGLSHRQRDDVERRFQNPAGPSGVLVSVPGRASVLVGMWEEDPHLAVPHPVIVMAEAQRRENHVTRWSLFVPLGLLTEAATAGWASHVSGSNEPIRCVFPELLPAAIAADVDQAEPDASLVQTAIEASGLAAEVAQAEGSIATTPAAERARRAAYSLVRDARFSRRVLSAYDWRCAMCGLGLRLVQGAHIYPASAPSSPDEPWNGLALCANHHLAFDRYLVAVHPGDRSVYFRQDVLVAAASDDGARALVDSTLPALRPSAAHARPRADMFIQRYAFYADDYGWLPDNFR